MTLKRSLLLMFVLAKESMVLILLQMIMMAIYVMCVSLILQKKVISMA